MLLQLRERMLLQLVAIAACRLDGAGDGKEYIKLATEVKRAQYMVTAACEGGIAEWMNTMVEHPGHVCPPSRHRSGLYGQLGFDMLVKEGGMQAGQGSGEAQPARLRLPSNLQCTRFHLAVLLADRAGRPPPAAGVDSSSVRRIRRQGSCGRQWLRGMTQPGRQNLHTTQRIHKV